MNYQQLKQYLFNNLRYGENNHEGNRPRMLVGVPYDIRALHASLLMPLRDKVWGIDISHWNLPPVDLKRMVDLYGLCFVIIKGCDGSLNSRYYEEHKTAAKAAGIPWGIYNWLYPNSRVSIDAQVNAWHARFAADPAPMGIFIDAEWTTYAGAPANPSAIDLRSAHDKWRARSGQAAITYTAKSFADTYLRGFDWSREELWIANYGVFRPALPTGAGTYTFWQFAATLDGSQLDPGGNAELDGNYFNGSLQDFVNRFGGTIPPPPQPIPFGYSRIRRYNNDVHIVKLENFTDAYVTNTQGRLEKVSDVARAHRARYAINGDGWRDTLFEPLSLAASDGDLYMPRQFDARPFVNITPNNQVTIAHQPGSVVPYNLVSGARYIVKDGANYFDTLGSNDPEHVSERSPRTAVGSTADGTLILCVVGGWDSTSPTGVTLKELANIMLEAGAQVAIDMDGGRSSYMAVDGVTVNSNREDSVINHLLIFTEGVTPMAKNKVTITWDAGARERQRPRVNTADTFGGVLADNTVHYSDVDPVHDMDAPGDPSKRWIQLQSDWFVAVDYPSSGVPAPRARVEAIAVEPGPTPAPNETVIKLTYDDTNAVTGVTVDGVPWQRP